MIFGLGFGRSWFLGLGVCGSWVGGKFNFIFFVVGFNLPEYSSFCLNLLFSTLIAGVVGRCSRWHSSGFVRLREDSSVDGLDETGCFFQRHGPTIISSVGFCCSFPVYSVQSPCSVRRLLCSDGNWMGGVLLV